MKLDCSHFRTFLAGLMVFISTTAFSQLYSINGVLSDAHSGDLLGGAHIHLLDPSSSMIKTAISDDAGKFILERVRPGTYTLRFSYVGYEQLQKEILITDQDTVLGHVPLQQTSTVLEGASVTGQVPMAAQIGDTTQFNAEAFTTMPDATAEDLVEKLPGVVVEDGKVEAMGEELKQVLVDGRPFFRNDPAAALRTLPAEVIDKIQIFNKESDQAEFTGFSDGETQKAMNIITRVNMRKGVFGKSQTGIGYGDNTISEGFEENRESARYTLDGNINFFNGPRRITLVTQSNNVNEQNFSTEDLLGVMSSGRGRMGGGARGNRGGMSGSDGRRGGPDGGLMGGDISDFMVAKQPGISTTHSLGLNYSDLWGENVDATASYFFNLSDNDALEDLYRLYTVGADSGQTYEEISTSASRNMNHRFNMRLEYNMDENNAIFIRPKLTFQQNDGTSSFDGETRSGSSLLNRLENTNNSNLGALNFSNTFLYRHSFNKERRTLSANIFNRISNQGGDSYLGSLTEYYTNPVSSEELDQYSQLTSGGMAISGNLIYTEPVGQNGMAQLNYMASYQKDDSDRKTYNFNNPDQDYTDMDTLLSNVFHNNYITQRAGAGYMYHRNSLFLTGRLRFQHAALHNEQLFPSEHELNKYYRDLLATAIMRYRPSGTKNVSMVYRTSTRPPTISQLQNVVDNSNTVQLTTGNPDLEQTYTHTLFIRFSSVEPESSRVFFAMLNGNITSNYIANHTIYATQDTMLETGILLKQGTQLILPVNLDGYRSVRSFLTYGLPVTLLRFNLNFNLGYNFSRNPGLINDIRNFSNNHHITAGVVVSSNFSEYLDFTISSRSGYNMINNSYNTEQDHNYFDQRTRFRFKGVLPKGGFLLESLLTQRLASGLLETYDQNNWIWSVALGRKLFANRLGEIKLGIYDILNQSQAITRSVGDIYVEDVENNILQRYFMLTFTYNLRKFDNPRNRENEFRTRMREMGREMN